MKRISGKGLPFLKTVAAALLLVMTAVPVLYLMFGFVAAAFKGKIVSYHMASFGLLARSILLNAGASFLSMLLGLLVALGIWVYFERHAVKISVGIALLILLPPFVHVQSWIFCIDKFNNAIRFLFGSAPNFTGEYAVVLTTAIAYLPVTAALCLISLLSVPPEISDLCFLDDSSKRAFFAVYLPYLFAPLCMGGLLVFLLNINEYAIASVFGTNVYALELYARFSAGSDLFEVFYASLPLLLLCLVLTALMGLLLSKSSFSVFGIPGKNPFKSERFIIIPAALGVSLFVIYLFVPLLNLLIESCKAKEAFSALANAIPELSYSFLISLLAAVFCIVPALLFSYAFYRSKVRVLLLALMALPFLIPSSIAGLSLIKMWNTPLLKVVYQSPVMPSVALMARFAFIEVLLLTAAVARIDKSLLETMRMYHPGIKGFLGCLVPMIWRDCVSGMLIVFALSMGEFGVALLVTPPGYQMLTIKIYNYLHYGASETVAVLCLFVLLIVAAVVAAVFLLLTGKQNEIENR